MFKRLIEVGKEKGTPYIKHSSADQKVLDIAYDNIENTKLSFNEIHDMLEPLITQENPEAQFLSSCFPKKNESEEEFKEREAKMTQMAAAGNFAPAVYQMGFYSELGDMEPYIPKDTKKAALFYMQAGELGHVHSMWLYGKILLYGAYGIEKNIEQGLNLILEAADNKFEGAVNMLAEFYEKGLHGFPKDNIKSLEWKQKLNDPDLIGF